MIRYMHFSHKFYSNLYFFQFNSEKQDRLFLFLLLNMLNIRSRDIILSDMKDIDDDISKVDDDLIEILSKLFAIESPKRCSVCTYFKNIFIPYIYSHKPYIKDYFLEVINCLDIIKSQIVPISLFGRNLVSQSFRYMIIDNESKESSNEFSISPELSKKKRYLYK